MSGELIKLLRHLEDMPVKSESIERTINELLFLKTKHAEDTDNYELNKAVGSLLADNYNTVEYADVFLINAVNENRDEPNRRKLLSTLAAVFEAFGDIEREEMVLRNACQHSPTMLDIKKLAEALLRLGEEEEASKIFRQVLDFYYQTALEHAQQRGGEVTQLLWPNIPICSRFGEIAHCLDVYIKARKLGLTPKVNAILTTRPEWISNNVLLDYWREQHSDEVTILIDPTKAANAEEIYQGCDLCIDILQLPGDRTLHTNWASTEIWNLWADADGSALLTLRDDHRKVSREWMRQRGFPDNGWFAAFHIREPGYHHETGKSPNRHRDSRVEDYFPAMKAIVDRGGWVVRIGDQSMTPLPEMEHVIDYTVSMEHDEVLDVFFCADAKFMVAVSSGGLAVANVFGTPVLAVNMFPPGDYSYSRQDFYIHKHLRRRDTGKFLNAGEMVAPPLRLMLTPRHYEEQGLDVIPNTAEDIEEAVEEMMLRLNDEFEMSEQDQANVRRYRELNDYPGIRTPSAPTATFLRRYPHLVE